MSDRTIGVVTGTRAEYGLLKSSMEAIRDHPELDLTVYVTGMHLSPQYGNTRDDIVADGFEDIVDVHMLLDGDSELSMVKSLGVGISSFADAFGRDDPDIVVVLGDRDEALAAGMTAAHMNIPVAHIHGGDTTGGAIIDDSIRHALTKFAHIHFPVSPLSEQRILELGEEPWRTMVVGAPGLDDILAGEYNDPDDVLKRHDISTEGRPLALVVQHPVTTAPGLAGEQMRTTLDSIAASDVHPVIIYPNSDAGGKLIIDEIDSHPVGERATVFRSLPRSDYLGLMAAADVMVGNSSSGIIEAPSFDLPVVNIGPRQDERERSENTLDVPHEATAISDAIETALTDDFRERVAAASNPYDHGGAAQNICDRLATIDLGEEVLRKRLTY
ncbi:UDP-N-acetylglucosamine 2-epimerase (hydrolyzing) [Haloferax larsenii]|uniref:UDP-N-acetylglucosamine 2-epimerase (Hydrolyzing) n=1 Tax=Haloferax larsenii TaxID=302484 RepID=A0ABY5RDS4_HALLR|nr:UDP-N-acetylglucosamine 2-epimerase [Haloferax larsenii]UVE49757.1 UDP-N-acetylglucosamine 2-epimerase (hydrolyzing) [Haloferax larsenii]